MVHQFLHNINERLLVDHSVQQVQGPQANTLISIVQTLQNQVLQRQHALRVGLQDLGHGQQAQILQILVRILDQNPQLLHAELDGGGVVGQAGRHGQQHRDHRIDALIQQRHGGRGMDQRGQGLDQFLAQPRFQRSQRAEQLDYLDQHPVVGGIGHEFEEGRRQSQIVFRMFPGQFTDHIHRRWLDSRVGVFQLFLQPREAGPQSVRISVTTWCILFMVHGLWSTVYGPRSMVCGLWSMVYGLWSMVYGLWSVVYGLWSMVYGLWFMVYGPWEKNEEMKSILRTSRKPCTLVEPLVSVRKPWKKSSRTWRHWPSHGPSRWKWNRLVHPEQCWRRRDWARWCLCESCLRERGKNPIKHRNSGSGTGTVK